MKTITITLSLIAVAVGMYLQYKVLQHIGATELMWFLYAVNVPILIVVTILNRALDKELR